MTPSSRIVTATVLVTAALLGLAGCPSKATSPDLDAPTANAPGATAPDEMRAGEGSCDKEIALTCAAGSKDGCLLQSSSGEPLTSSHVCVPENETAGPPCEQEIAKVCGEGFVDACLLEPRPAKSHVCVAKPS